MTIKIGTVDYTPKSFSDRPKKNYFNLVSGDNVFRILPPVGGLADKGKYAVKYRSHAGYRGAPDETGKQRYYSFLCVEERDFKAGTVTVKCPECEKIKEMQDLYNSSLEQYTAQGKSKEQITELLLPLQTFLDTHFLSTKFHVNAMNSNNEIGLLRLPVSAVTGIGKKEKVGGLFKEIDRLVKQYGPECDPVGQKGALFNFRKSGSGRFGTNYEVTPVMELVNVPNVGKVPLLKEAPLTEEIKARMETECHDLSDLYTRLDQSAIQQLVDSDGDPDVADTVFARSFKRVDTDFDPATFTSDYSS